MCRFGKRLIINGLCFLTVSQRCQLAKKASPLRCNRVLCFGDNVKKPGVIASPLRCNRVAITVKHHLPTNVTGCNRVAVMVQWQTKMAEKSPTVLRKGERLPFFRSICPCLQVLNFGNNILQFNVDAAFPFQTRMYIRVHCSVLVGIAH